jgi:hypothetical protein
MLRRNFELWLSLLIIILITAGYLQIVTKYEVPAASGFLGHSLGVIGFILILMTEILYSLRKRYQFARWGKLEHWLSFHIITGIIGPYLVLLHTSWKFNGLAGILMLFTIIIVASGFIGRYFYTAIPRSTEGTILEAEQVSVQIKLIEQEISDWKSSQPETYQQIEQNNPKSISGLSKLKKRQGHLTRQLKNLDRSRRMLAIWHTFHIPLGISLFVIASIHIAATLYFATLLH